MFIIHILFTYERKKNMNYKIIVANENEIQKGREYGVTNKN